MDRDDTTWAPFLLYEYEEGGRYGLLLFDSRMGPTEAVFEQAGRSPGGYGWADVAAHIVATRAPELAGTFRQDPEAGMFCAYGDDRPALQTLAALLHGVFHDHADLAAVLKDAPYAYD